MPRRPRICFENAFYHVFNRGLNKELIFRQKKDYIKFLQCLQDLKAKKKYDHSIYAYVLMPNHFHLLIQTKKIPIGKIMSSLSTSYAMYFNKTYKRVGMLFQNRFKSKLCQKEDYFLGASRYIHLNPIVAGLVNNFEAYPWSSYHELFGTTSFSIIDKKEVIRLVGETPYEREVYRKFLEEGMLKFKDRDKDRDKELEKEYLFDDDISGKPSFNSITQKKYIRRKNNRHK